jgi:Spy/CpxP family protein refolding chaperone
MSGRGNDGARLMRHFPEIADRLGLSDAQRDAIEQSYYDNKATGIDLEARAEKARLELQRQMVASTLDEKAVLKAFDAVAAAEVETHRNDLRLLLAIRKQLTPEQWKQLTSMREQMRSMRREERREEREDREEK